MERRINKALLLVTIALLGPLGLGTLGAAHAAPLAELASEAQPAQPNVSAPAPSVAKVVATFPNTQSAKLKSQNLSFGWVLAVAHTLYERVAFSVVTLGAIATNQPLPLALHPGSSAGGLWRLSRL